MRVRGTVSRVFAIESLDGPGSEKFPASLRGDFFASQVGGGDGVGVGHAEVGRDGVAGGDVASVC